MSEFYNQHKGRLALYIFLGAFLLRVTLDIIFFLRSGWFSSHLIEVWFYYGVARGVYTLSFLDPTFLLLRIPGLLITGPVLYQIVVFEAALISALTAVLIFYWLDSRCGRAAGWWGGVVFALLPAPITLSLVNFSHDLVQIPLLVLFFWAAGLAIDGRGRRIRAGILAAVCLLLGMKIGPLMAGALGIIFLYGLWAIFRRLVKAGSSWWSSAIFLAVLIMLNYGFYLLIKPNLLEWIAPLALKFRGIDLMAQVRIQVGDLQPLPRDAFWNRYTLFIFFLPWGIWTTFKKRDFLTFSLFTFSLALALVVNRGARLLDLAVVILAAQALANWKRSAGIVTIAAVCIYIAVDLVSPGLARGIYFGIPYGLTLLWGSVIKSFTVADLQVPEIYLRCGWLFAGFFAVIIIWAGLFKGKMIWIVGIILASVILLQGSWVLLAANTSSDQVEYEAYQWLDNHSRPGEKIFAAWNQGYFLGSTTGLIPVTTPEKIDFDLSRTYWMEEKDSARELRRRGVKYIHVTSRYFGITGVNEKNDTFTMRGNTIIGPRPDHIRRFSRMRKTFLYRMIYEPDTFRYFRPVHQEIDQERKVLVRFFEVN
jgi:hypothetical protein